eukprot:351226-Chlamydomonas_euryale.AAC.3
MWVPISRSLRGPTLGRTWYEQPRSEGKERYFLRVPPCGRGMHSWANCRTVEDISYPTMKEAYEALRCLMMMPTNKAS